MLGPNDGIVSTASLIVGVAAADSARSSILVARLAGMVAGTMSMTAGEYVPVSSQADTVGAGLARDRHEVTSQPQSEHAELTAIYVRRGRDEKFASEVATQLMAKDALAAHARDGLGITEKFAARPVQAAFATAASFTVGAAMPLLLVLVLPKGYLV